MTTTENRSDAEGTGEGLVKEEETSAAEASLEAPAETAETESEEAAESVAWEEAPARRPFRYKLFFYGAVFIFLLLGAGYGGYRFNLGGFRTATDAALSPVVRQYENVKNFLGLNKKSEPVKTETAADQEADVPFPSKDRDLTAPKAKIAPPPAYEEKKEAVTLPSEPQAEAPVEKTETTETKETVTAPPAQTPPLSLDTPKMRVAFDGHTVPLIASQPNVLTLPAEDYKKMTAALRGLRHVFRSGGPFVRELTHLKQIFGEDKSLSALESFAREGAPSETRLTETGLKAATAAAVTAPVSEDGNILEKIGGYMRRYVAITPLNPESAQGQDDRRLARIVAALKKGDFQKAESHIPTLQPAASGKFRHWMKLSQDRRAAIAELNGLEDVIFRKLYPEHQ